MLRVTALVLLLTVTGRAAAQDACTVILKLPGPGDVTVCEDSVTSSMATRKLNAAGDAVNEGRSRTERQLAFRDTVLDTDPKTGQATRLRRQCDKAILEDGGKGSVLPYHAKIFTVERAGGACRVRFEGEAPPAEFVAQMEASFAKMQGREEIVRSLLPNRPVKPGESWQFDPSPLLAAWPKPPQVRFASATTGTGKLREVTDRGGRRHAVMDFTAIVPVTGVELGGRQAEVETENCLRIDVTLDACIDGTSAAYTLRLTDDLTVRLWLDLPGGERVRGVISERHERTETRR
jgi:hypothetical protein